MGIKVISIVAFGCRGKLPSERLVFKLLGWLDLYLKLYKRVLIWLGQMYQRWTIYSLQGPIAGEM
jgi:hypothetical protein